MPRHLLFQAFDQRVGGLGAHRIFLVDGDVGRRHVERETEHGLAGRPNDVADAGEPGGREDVVGGDDVVRERGGIGGQPGRRDRGEVHDCVHTVVPVVDGGERLDDLAVVGEVDAHRDVGHRVRVGHAVERDRAVAVLVQVAHDVTAQLAAAAGDRNGDHGISDSRVSGRIGYVS
jgi:hypothetical protein